MSRNRRLISTMIKNNVAVLYIDNNAYVSAKTVEENRLIARQVAGAEAFAYKYLASYGVENESKKEADKMFADDYVVRFSNADRSVYTA